MELIAEERAAKQGKRIKREKTRLRRLLKDADPDRLKAIDVLIGNVAFMGVTLQDLQDHINREGINCTYQNGENQWGEKKSPEAEYYASLMQRYLPAMKQLIELLPAAPTLPREGDPLLEWTGGNRGRA